MENIDKEEYLISNVRKIENLYNDFKSLLSLFGYIKEDIAEGYDKDAGNVFFLGYDFLKSLIEQMSVLIKEIYNNKN